MPDHRLLNLRPGACLPWLLLLIALPCLRATAQESTTLSGRVLSDDGWSAVPGAVVRVLLHDLRAETNEFGAYEVRGVPPGTLRVSFEADGYRTQIIEVKVAGPTLYDAVLARGFVEHAGAPKNRNMAEAGRSAAAFRSMAGPEIHERFATQDVPGLLTLMPAVWAVDRGPGQAALRVRGTAAEASSAAIRGIPLDDPETHDVDWSAWTVLPECLSLLQLQRGAAATLFGPIPTGGALEMLRGGYDMQEAFRIRLSGSGYGAGDNAGNYAAAGEYTTGFVGDGSTVVALRYERRAGSGAIANTAYNGHGGYAGVQWRSDGQRLQLNMLGTVQHHNTAFALQDPRLTATLGDYYSRTAHPWFEQESFQPLIDLQHEWTIDARTDLVTTLYGQFGRTETHALRNDVFDVPSGAVEYQPLSASTDAASFGAHARWAWEHAGVQLQGYDPATQTYDGAAVPVARNLTAGDQAHSWRDARSTAYAGGGLQSSLAHAFSPALQVQAGVEGRWRSARHELASEQFRALDAAGAVIVADVQKRGDYEGTVLQLGGVAGLRWDAAPAVRVLADLRLRHERQQVEEQPIEIYDFGAARYTGVTTTTSSSLRAPDGAPLLGDDAYTKSWTMLLPRLGLVVSPSRTWRLTALGAITARPPGVPDWYDPASGPRVGAEPRSERSWTAEAGTMYSDAGVTLGVNLYTLTTSHALVRFTTPEGDCETVNGGETWNRGVEVNGSVRIGDVQVGAVAAFAKSTWQSMEAAELGGAPAADVLGAWVPLAPALQLGAELAWRPDGSPVSAALTLDLRDGVRVSYDNRDNPLPGESARPEAVLPTFADLGARITWDTSLDGTRLRVVLRGGNLLNRAENTTDASWTRDMGRNDGWNGTWALYVAQAPPVNGSMTLQLEL